MTIKNAPSFGSVETRYHGATDTKGARISVRISTNGKSVKYYDWDYAHSELVNHQQAAAKYIKEGRDWPATEMVYAGTPKGYIFTITKN